MQLRCSAIIIAEYLVRARAREKDGLRQSNYRRNLRAGVCPDNGFRERERRGAKLWCSFLCRSEVWYLESRWSGGLWSKFSRVMSGSSTRRASRRGES